MLSAIDAPVDYVAILSVGPEKKVEAADLVSMVGVSCTLEETRVKAYPRTFMVD
jgi:hypothetical protein